MNGLLSWLRRLGARHPRCRAAMAWLHNRVACNSCRVSRGVVVVTREAWLRHVLLVGDGGGNEVSILPGARVSRTRILLRGRGNAIVVGADCVIKGGVLWCEGTGSRIEIGAGTTIEEAHIAANEGTRVAIGRDCMLGFDVDIRSSDSHAITDPVSGERLNPAADISIGDHVWLAAHTQVLKGVGIGNGAVIGIRSVVTGEVPAAAVACGNPARVVRENMRWTRTCDDDAV